MSRKLARYEAEELHYAHTYLKDGLRDLHATLQSKLRWMNFSDSIVRRNVCIPIY